MFRRLREGCLLLTLAFSVLLLLALMTYHQADPGWSHSVHAARVFNAVGKTGAWLADFFLYMFGYIAYIFPLLMIYVAWLTYRRSRIGSPEDVQGFAMFGLRLTGFIFVLSSSCALASMHVSIGAFELPYNAGGVLGTAFGSSMLTGFNNIGATLILCTVWLVGVTLLTGLSWLSITEIVGRFAVKLVHGGAWLFKGRVQRLEFTWLRSCLNSLKGLPGLFKSKLPALKRRVEPNVPIKEARNKKAHVFDEQEQLADPLASKVLAGDPLAASTLSQYNAPPAEITEDMDPIEALALQKAAEFARAPLKNKPKRQRRLSRSQQLPALDLLDIPIATQAITYPKEQVEMKSREVEQRLSDFGVKSRVVAVHPGPVVTRYELQLAAGTKVSKISGLAKDLARSLSVISVRVVEVIQGKSVIGLELPNESRATVSLHEVLVSKAYQQSYSVLSLALGKDIAGHPVIVDLAKMPHLLVAGTTGSGKSVSLNTMLLSLLYQSTPKELRMILIDPKMLELSIYDGIPHLLAPVVTDMKDAASALRWCVVEMEKRYRLMAAVGVRNIAGYNEKVKAARERGSPMMDPLASALLEQPPAELEELPRIVVLADEFADMMVVVGKKVESLISRLAQKARAAGIHLILATQRPSVDVITGLIKANIPTRIAFQVSSKIDSRTILDQQGAEQLLGNGDMLYLPPGSGVPVRVHGAFVSDDEVHRVVKNIKENGAAEYNEDILNETILAADASGYTQATLGEDAGGERDELYDQAVEMVVKARRVSVSSIQRRFKIGYNRAARIVDAMEAAGVVSGMESNGNREVLAPAPEQ